MLYPNGHHGHNVHFLVHSLNLDGRFKDSMKRVQHMMTLQGNAARARRQQPAHHLPPGLLQPGEDDRRASSGGTSSLDGQTIPVYDRPEQQRLARLGDRPRARGPGHAWTKRAMALES